MNKNELIQKVKHLNPLRSMTSWNKLSVEELQELYDDFKKIDNADICDICGAFIELRISKKSPKYTGFVCHKCKHHNIRPAIDNAEMTKQVKEENVREIANETELEEE